MLICFLKFLNLMSLNTIKIPTELIEKISQDKCAVYVGAGLSMGAGLPSWENLLQDMINWSLNYSIPLPKEVLQKMIGEGKFLKVANIIVKKMGSQRFVEFLVSVFRKHGLKPTEAHLLLPKIPFTSVLTSNYDKLIESAYTIVREGESVPVFTHSNHKDLATVLYSDEFHITKTHGNIDDIESVVLSLEDYQKLMQSNEPYKIYLQNIFTTKTVLFLGFSLNDPDLNSILDGLRVHLKKITPPHYALIEANMISEIEAEELRDSYNIHVLRYKASSHSHPEVTEFLREIGEKVPKKHLRQLTELKNNLDEIDTHYKIVASTDEKFEIQEKYPGASEEKPLTISFGLEDKESIDELQRHIDTGEEITISPKDVSLPEIFTKLFHLNPDEIKIVIGSAKSDKILRVRAIVQAEGEDNVTIENIELKKVRGGKKESVLSNEHQNHFFQVKIIFDLTYNEQPNTYKAEIKLSVSRSEDNIKNQLLMDRFLAVAYKGAKFYFENVDTGMPAGSIAYIKAEETLDHPKWIPILEALLQIQTATQTQFSVPKSLSNDEINLILNIAYVIKNGISKGDVKYTMEVDSLIIQDMLDKEPNIDFSTYSEDRPVIQGKRINLGMSWITCNPVISEDEQIRLREEIKKTPEQVRHLVAFATTAENQAISYFFDYLSLDDFENLHANPKYRKFALDYLIKTLFEAAKKVNEEIDTDILLSCFESATKQINSYGRPYNMLPRASIDELKSSLKEYLPKLKNSQRVLLFNKLVKLKIISDEDEDVFLVI